MKRVACLSYFLLLAFNTGLQAHNHQDQEEPFATSTFDSAEEPGPFTVTTQDFRDTFVDLSLYGNLSLKDGNIDPNEFGIEIEEDGDYEVHISAVLVNEGGSPLVLAMFLVDTHNNVVDFPSPPIGATGTFFSGVLKDIDGFGYLKDVKKDTFLTLKIANVNGGSDRNVAVLGWTISARKIDHHRRHDGEQ